MNILKKPKGYNNTCIYCGEQACENCELPYLNDKTLGDYLDLIKSKNENYNFELEIFFDNAPKYLKYDKINNFERPKQNEEEEEKFQKNK